MPSGRYTGLGLSVLRRSLRYGSKLKLVLTIDCYTHSAYYSNSDKYRVVNRDLYDKFFLYKKTNKSEENKEADEDAEGEEAELEEVYLVRD